MKSWRRFVAFGFSGLGALSILPAPSGAQQRAAVVDQIAKTYGLASFGQIEAIRYAFNAEATALHLS
jgi:hypothetical protein